jgi:hypothetical protein
MMQEVFATVVAVGVLSLGLLTMALLTMAPDASAKRRRPPRPGGYQQRLIPKVNGLRLG